jgi:antitoxin component YwqK of YwqJK toxin-antitoxin module
MDGTLKMASSYKDNLRHGEQTYYYPNGQLYYNGFYSDDLKLGVWEFFTEEGVSDTLINYNE